MEDLNGLLGNVPGPTRFSIRVVPELPELRLIAST
jgi:hypothetical protein